MSCGSPTARDTAKPDSVAMGTFILDSHCVQRLVTPDGLAIDKGNFDVPVRPYQIAYRSITPVAEQCENLLVPVCLSASHVAYGSIRMEPQYMMLGHAAGLAAVMAIERKAAVQDIDVPRLQRTLRSQKQDPRGRGSEEIGRKRPPSGCKFHAVGYNEKSSGGRLRSPAKKS